MWSRGVQGDAGKERLTHFSLSSSIMPLKAAPKRKPARNKAVKSNKTTEKNAATKRKAKEEANRRAKEKANRKAKEEANRRAKEKIPHQRNLLSLMLHVTEDGLKNNFL